MPRCFDTSGLIRRSAMAGACLAAGLALAACATTSPARVASVATTPLSDLNLVVPAIPEILLAARAAPYRLPDNLNCASVKQELLALDEALGPDLDAPQSAEPGLVERGGSAAQNLAIDALQRTAEGVIPFRGWIRKLSGADRQSQQASAALQAGIARRAFLKGLNAGRGCD